jgi:pyroglutamyl-peptidase
VNVSLIGNILLTGFEPFGGDTLNPSGEVAKALDGARTGEAGEYKVVTKILPVEWVTTRKVMASVIEEVDPVMIMSLGLASGRPELNVEKVAVNYTSRYKDNKGSILDELNITNNGPDAYFATIPVEDIVEAIKAKGIPARLSLSAGSYLCNYTFYSASDYIAQKGKRDKVPVGFIHIPATPDMVAGTGKSMASMDLDMIKHGVMEAIGVSVKFLTNRGA